MTLPLVFRDRSIGLLTVANKTTDYDESDRETLQAIAEYVAPVLHGILERKSVERALQDNEEKYRNLFTDAQVALFRIRMSDGALIALNERYARMAGYSSIERCMENYNPGKSWINPYERDEFFRFLRKSNIVDNYETSVVSKNGTPDREVWLVIKRTIEESPTYSYFLSNAPVSTRLPAFVWLSGLRWPIEQCFEETKTELGMDHYEVRKYRGWHHHMLTCMLAHFFLWHLKIRLGKKSASYYAVAA